MLTGWRKTVSKFFIIPQRYVIAIMGFLAVFNAYTMRICLSVAILAMVVPKNTTGIDPNDDTCPISDDSANDNGTIIDVDKLYNWSSTTQGLILSSFYWGYVLTHLPGGFYAGKFGGKYALNLGILSTSIFTLLTPVVVEKFDYQGLVVLRVLEGLGEGTTIPAVSALLAKWVPLHERARMSAIVFSGTQLGTIVGNVLSGYMIEITNEWSSVFYLYGGVGLAWFIISLFLCYSEPETHPFITDDEKEFLRKELESVSKNKYKIIPWKQIFTCVPLWSLVVVQIGHDWGFFAMITDLPKYMSDVMKFDVGENGLWSSLPYILMWMTSLSSGYLSDYLLKREYMTISFTRKLLTTIASIGPGVLIVSASYAGCNKAAAVALFTIAMGFMGPYYCSMKVNSLDLSPNHAGIMMAMVNGLGAVSGIIIPYLIGALTEDHTLSQWRLVFWITFGVLVLTNLQYLYFGSAEPQWWDNPQHPQFLELGAKESCVRKEGRS